MTNIILSRTTHNKVSTELWTMMRFQSCAKFHNSHKSHGPIHQPVQIRQSVWTGIQFYQISFLNLRLQLERAWIKKHCTQGIWLYALKNVKLIKTLRRVGLIEQSPNQSTLLLREIASWPGREKYLWDGTHSKSMTFYQPWKPYPLCKAKRQRRTRHDMAIVQRPCKGLSLREPNDEALC